MPRLTSRVFTDLAIWMAGFGLLVGLVFPPFCIVLGLPADRALSPAFYASTLAAGVVVGGANFVLAHLVVGRRLRLLAERMGTVEQRLAGAVFTHDWTGCEPSACALPVDSDDEVGAGAAAFNRLIGTLARSHAVESAMRAFSEVLSSRFELEGLGAAALEALLAHTGAEAGALLVVRDEGVETVAIHGLRAERALEQNEHVRRALRSGRVARLRVAPGELVVDSLLGGQPARAVIVAPVVFKSVSLGVIVLATASDFGPDAVGLLEQFRADLGLAVTNAMAHERLERLAAVDPLTDAYNRRFGLARLGEEFSRAVRAESPLGLLMVDLDRFKSVNDTYGHPVGDRVLQGVAQALSREARATDLVARYGGEEFALIMPETDATGALATAERIRERLGQTAFETELGSLKVTLSLGIASCPEDAQKKAELIELADSCLYQAKRSGRNRTVLASALRPARRTAS